MEFFDGKAETRAEKIYSNVLKKFTHGKPIKYWFKKRQLTAAYIYFKLFVMNYQELKQSEA